MAERQGAGSDIFGSALQPANDGFGVVADVYADRVRELAGGREAEVVLGRVITHELGHLLLGKNAHSAAGIMHATWRARDLELTREAAMSFLPSEAKRIRAQVLARMNNCHQPTAPHPESATRATAEPDPKFAVFAYNYAAIPSEVMTQTKTETARIFQLAGIEIRWLDCPLSSEEADQFPACQVPPGPTRLALRILSRSMAERLRQALDSFGFALYPDDGSFAMVVWI